MQSRWVAILTLVAISILAAAWFWLAPPTVRDGDLRAGSPDATPDRSRSAEAVEGSHGPVEVPARPRSPSTSQDPAFEERAHADHGPVEDPTGDLELYRRSPMSAVPHQVVRGWGARGAGSIPGVVGAYVVVDAGLDDEQLARLARDIRKFHGDADALSVRILDSEAAATYDRHSDGGALAAQHLVGLVNRNTRMGIDRIEIRGREIEIRGSTLR